jgi:hypothetical protein
MKPTLVLLALSLAATIAGSHQPAAQGGRDSRDDGSNARTDALLGTPNKATPVPQANQFSTSPGLEQQAPGPQGKPPSKDQSAPRPPAGTLP